MTQTQNTTDTDRGAVTLSDEVEWHDQRAAEHLVWPAPRVTAVDDRLTIRN